MLLRPASDASAPVPDSTDLAKMRLLLLEEGHCFRDQALSFCGMPTLRPRDSMEGSSLTTLVQMVASGMGVTLIPEMAVPLETRSADVAIARFAPPEPTRSVGLVWRKSSPMGDLFRDIAALVGAVHADETGQRRSTLET